ncbi:hypothetical protein [Granulicella mallensis]|uniref:RiboL-PSP-HEPN domain-containing protein n=1 Tax=Granulicella mallensis TaxID=940614 RepID=A0A7W8ECZ5_9BACT|nr:hypothetical protein [Granulicella mallensis]MBB5066155.1 hypothetical protein [Granulicella mallensis]
MSTNPNSKAKATRRLRNILADNTACEQRVKMMLDAITVAHEFTRDRQEQSMLETAASISRLDIPADLVSWFRNNIPTISVKRASDLSSSMRAASLIFAHSHLDKALNQLLMLSVLLRPSDWNERINDSCQTKYSLKDLRSIDPLKMAINATNQFLTRQKHAKITKRNTMLLRYVGKYPASPNYHRLDTQALELFDAMRHQLIHESSHNGLDLSEATGQRCLAVVSHVGSLIESVAQYIDIPFDEVDSLEPVGEVGESDVEKVES